jgi:hypothetical protein
MCVKRITEGDKQLWTGYYPPGKPVGNQPPHDDEGAKKGLNKDNPGRGANHANAIALAKRATREWYRRFLTFIPTSTAQDQAVRDLFVKPSGSLNVRMVEEAGAGSTAAAALGKALRILEK